ncbi:hypothetical protein [Schleiferilactobacillus perolens]|jgi:hypothetical protein|uniref:Uncharacterized protein n=1 Tax=Schleiferilactobacillus perolens DSM 12744 TaxID=1423792 RepID=A0A0R1N4D8_9LACO|nr:hypothetical protein [Schleiferilactobacillus perolens]KRL12250.1 hypothetical protein FD09_GL003120 [Schleiferilactobacillus perolens DSM 12744]MCI1891198.1 hypothetical protein [Schleiferilactobacillus harbinensis]MCI1911864.1 hypothetical protein [Schleiferilactobacillus harbinensis]MCI2171635.1 hypothetical protein [Schleiferilactobacillus perolens]
MRKRSLFVMSLGFLMIVFSPLYGSDTHLNYWWLGGGAFVVAIGVYDLVASRREAKQKEAHGKEHHDDGDH